MIRILLADDHPVLRHVLVPLIAEAGDMAVVAECESGDELLHEGLRVRPDVVLVDPELPGMDPLQASCELHEQLPRVRVLVHARCFSLVTFSRAQRLGAVGYLLKSDGLDDLPRRIRAVVGGATAWTPGAPAR
ncbi:response regulator [Geodermatophilus sabuli]|uniref:Two-component system, NarL family, response regulator DesR n=1 Tax=Geodermatophilus sabuli TaxID=1564158 RepID=A0A285EJX4_9ACTN|nr:response regulator transcription factor [Geodermatophilus sabuli]MBB3083797.1 DNA-binding NarL/FixJ family response regulator [Geodermatophilus sabuli]SNX99310.1 two-component system, NarL family, response regulator DesR [Geodermatophilus sabuli]